MLSAFAQANFGGRAHVRDLIEMGFDEIWHGYDYLVVPLGRWAEPGDIVYVVPHGLFHYLPLHAL